MSKDLYVIFDGPPGAESGRFVELEGHGGHSVGKESGASWSKGAILRSWVPPPQEFWRLGPFASVSERDGLRGFAEAFTDWYAQAGVDLYADDEGLKGLAEQASGALKPAQLSREPVTMLTREICKACGKENSVGFTVPDEVWRQVTTPSYSVLCISCFTQLADRLGLAWDDEIELYPVSRVTLQRTQEVLRREESSKTSRAKRIELKVGTRVMLVRWPNPLEATITGLIFYWAPGKALLYNDLALELEDLDGNRFADVYYHVTDIVQRGANGDAILVPVEGVGS